MPKTWKTPRDELICGKLDTLAATLTTPAQMDLLCAIRYDAERMEQALIRNKERARLGTGAANPDGWREMLTEVK